MESQVPQGSIYPTGTRFHIPDFSLISGSLGASPRSRGPATRVPVTETKTPLSPSACTGSRLPVLTRTGGKQILQRPKPGGGGAAPGEGRRRRGRPPGGGAGAGHQQPASAGRSVCARARPAAAGWLARQQPAGGAGAVGGSAAGRARRAQAGAGADARRHRARGGAPWWRLLRCRAAGRAVAAPRLVRGCAAAAGFAMARVLRRCHVA